MPLHEDLTKTQCNICLKFITIKSLAKHMAAFHKDPLSLTENNNNNKSSSSSGGGGRGAKNKGNEEKNNPCLYCKKSFISPAKLRLHVAKCHAAERHKTENLLQQQQQQQREQQQQR